MNHLRRGTRTHAVRVHAQQGHFPAFPKAAVWFTDRGYNVLLLPAGSMTTTSFLCCEKHFSVFRPLLYHGFCTASTPCRKFFRFFTKSKSARRYFSYHQALLWFFRGYSAALSNRPFCFAFSQVRQTRSLLTGKAGWNFSSPSTLSSSFSRPCSTAQRAAFWASVSSALISL